MISQNLETYDLGSYHWPVTAASAAAQSWFDRGVRWCHGFNHEAAVYCFERAVEQDPGCAMAYWGIAYAIGPNYNKPWALFDPVDLGQTLARANHVLDEADKAASRATDVERALIGSLRKRYPQGTEAPDLDISNEAYCSAMRAVLERFPDDLDVLTLYVEAVLDRTPWQMWDLGGAGPGHWRGHTRDRGPMQRSVP